MVMIDALAIALATVAMGIPAIITAAALGSKLGFYWERRNCPCRNGLFPSRALEASAHDPMSSKARCDDPRPQGAPDGLNGGLRSSWAGEITMAKVLNELERGCKPIPPSFVPSPMALADRDRREALRDQQS